MPYVEDQCKTMRKISPRKLIICAVYVFLCFITLMLWKNASTTISRTPESSPKQKSTIRWPTEIRQPKDNEYNVKKAQTQVEIVDYHRNVTDEHVSSAPTKTGTQPSKKMPAPRPSNCSGCFDTNFPILTDQPDLCQVEGNTTVDIIFFILSAPKYHAQRGAVRKTWVSVTENNTSNLRHVFVLGIHTDIKVMRALEEEARRFRDVVVFGFRDAYVNLTLKVVRSLRWVTTRCQNARMFMKVDDDVWVNTDFVKAILEKNVDFLQQGMVGACAKRAGVHRRINSKWYVSRYLYPKDRYPEYCTGAAYAGSMNVAKEIVRVSANVPFFYIEDVYVGMCLEYLGFRVRNIVRFKANYKNKLCKGYSGREVVVHKASPERMFNIWNGTCVKKKKEVLVAVT